MHRVFVSLRHLLQPVAEVFQQVFIVDPSNQHNLLFWARSPDIASIIDVRGHPLATYYTGVYCCSTNSNYKYFTTQLIMLQLVFFSQRL